MIKIKLMYTFILTIICITIFKLSIINSLLLSYLVSIILVSLIDTNFYKLIMIFGKKGTGKTSYIAKQTQNYIKKGYKVYTNINIPGAYTYNPQEIGLTTFEPNSVVFCDEVGLIWHNRDYKNFKKCLIEWFKYQRQYKIRMILFSQSYDIDKVLRDLTDVIYIIKRIGKFSILRRVNKSISVATDSNGNGTIVDTYKMGSIFDIKITYLPRYYGLFESFDPPKKELIKATFNDYNDISRIYSDTKKYILYQFKLKIRGIYEKINKLHSKN